MWLECGKACAEDDPIPCYVPCYNPSTALVYDDLSWMNPTDFSWLTATKRQAIIDQMTYLSQPPPADGQSVGPRIREFIFDDTTGGGVDAYILDTGANLDKAVSTPCAVMASHSLLTFI